MKPLHVHYQLGFLPGRSTMSNLALIFYDLIERVNQNWQVYAIYTDFPEAFDMVDTQTILIVKLNIFREVFLIS